MLSHVAPSARELHSLFIISFFIWQFNQHNWNESRWWVHCCVNLSSKGITTPNVSRIYQEGVDDDPVWWQRGKWQTTLSVCPKKMKRKRKSNNENHPTNIRHKRDLDCYSNVSIGKKKSNFIDRPRHKYHISETLERLAKNARKAIGR